MRDRLILDFDLGNSRAKWRLSRIAVDEKDSTDSVQQLETLRFGANSYDFDSDFQELENVDRIRIGSVVGDDRLNSLLNLCESRWQITPEIAMVREEWGGVRQGYRDKTRLGVDRWLALLAAYQSHKKGCVVVSCGSAVTVDLLAANGHHLGGYILPGIELMRKALFAGTNAVKLEAIAIPSKLEPGRDTVDAVNVGLPLMIKGVVEQALRQLEDAGGEKVLLLTGGDGEALSPLFQAQCEYNPFLVLDGLRVALP
ncbi:type III pantothenate kinase [Aurantivibrio infirmus]